MTAKCKHVSCLLTLVYLKYWSNLETHISRRRVDEFHCHFLEWKTSLQKYRNVCPDVSFLSSWSLFQRRHEVKYFTAAFIHHQQLAVGQTKPSFLFMLYCCPLWTRCFAALHIRYVWNLDQLGYAALRAKKAGKRERETEGPPYVRGPETGSSWLWISLWFSSKPSLGCLCLPPASLAQWLFTKQEAETTGWNNKSFLDSLCWFTGLTGVNTR